MNSVKILHCADIHLGAAISYLGSAATKRQVELLLTFEKILETACNEAVDIVLIAGDLFDSNHAARELMERVFNMIESIAPIKVVAVAGNHDPLTADSPYLTESLPKNLKVLNGEDGFIFFDTLKTRIYGRSFTDAYMYGNEEFSLLPPDDDIVNIMLLHADASGNINSEYNGISNRFIECSKMDYIALGHIHKRSEVMRSGATSYAYCGCPEGLGFDEMGPKGVYIGNIGKGWCQLEFVPLCKRMHLQVDVDISEIDLANIYQNIIEQLQKTENYSQHLYKIRLKGSIPEGYTVPTDEIASRLSDELYYVKLKDLTTVKVDLETLSQEHSLKGIFVRKMLERLNGSNSPEQQETLKCALDIGLRAFFSEVKYCDDK